MNNLLIFTDFRIFGNCLICFRNFDWKSDTRHSFLEFVAKSRQNFIKIHRKNAKFDAENEKVGNSFLIREKMLTIFGWNFEIWAIQKYVHLVDLVKSFPTSSYSNEYLLAKSASIQPRTSLSKFGGKFNSIFIRLLRAQAATQILPNCLQRLARSGCIVTDFATGYALYSFFWIYKTVFLN